MREIFDVIKTVIRCEHCGEKFTHITRKVSTKRYCPDCEERRRYKPVKVDRRRKENKALTKGR